MAQKIREETEINKQNEKKIEKDKNNQKKFNINGKTSKKDNDMIQKMNGKNNTQRYNKDNLNH